LNIAANRFRRIRAHRAHAHFHRERIHEGPGPDRVALAHLPERHRRALVLFHVADLSITEIAAQEGVAEGTVKSWLHRGRVALASQLTEIEDNHA
jgi:RNA polymerase sigma-70 factor, ECF subfamily